MIRQRVITVHQAEQAYSAMRNGGRRLPWDRVARQLRALEGIQIREEAIPYD